MNRLLDIKILRYDDIEIFFFIETRTKTSIRYAKENDRERERKVQGEI